LKGLSPTDATWEFADEIATRFLDFNLDDKVILMREDLSHAANTSIIGDDEQALTRDEERARTEGLQFESEVIAGNHQAD
jgi:hypothetical protein